MMCKIDFLSLFGLRHYAPVRGDEYIMTMEQQKAYETKKRIIQGLDDLEASETFITDEDVSAIVAEALHKRVEDMNNKAMKKPHTCQQCGAPLKNGKCEYCGTNYN